MKVYVLMRNVYDVFEVVGVFKTVEAADKVVGERKEDGWYYQIHERELNE